MGTSDLNFYINKHRKAYEERLKREQQNLQGKTFEGEAERGAERGAEREAEKVSPSEVAKGDANEQSNESDSRSKNQNEGYSQHASQSDATRNSTRDENMNQVDSDYLFALKLNEALNGHLEPPSVANENDLSGSHARGADGNEDAERNGVSERNGVAEEDVRKPDSSYVECLLGDNNYMPYCLNYNVGSANMDQNPVSPSGRNRRSGHYVDVDQESHMYRPYNLRSRNNRVNGLHNSNQSSVNGSGNGDNRRSSPHFNRAHEPINISLSSDDEEGEVPVQVNNPAAKSYLSQDDGIRSNSEVFYVNDENLSLTPRQNKLSGQRNLSRPFSSRGEDSKEEVTIVEGRRQERFSDKGAYHHEEGNPDVCIQAHKGKGGEIPRMMESANNFSFQSVEAQGGGGPRAGYYNNCGADLPASKCTMEKSVHGLCDVYNDHFGFTSRGTFRPVRSAGTEVGRPLREGGHSSGNNRIRSNYVDVSPRDDYSQEGRYYVHYEPMNLSGKEKEKNKSTFEGVYDVDAYGVDAHGEDAHGERVDSGSVFLSRGKNRNGGGGGGGGEEEEEERTKKAEGEYHRAHVQDGNDVIPQEGKAPIGGAPSPYKARSKKSRREVKDITQVESIHRDEGLSPQIAQLDDAPKMAQLDGSLKMAYTLRPSRKNPTNEKIEDPYYCKGESYKAQNGRGLESAPQDDFILRKTGLGRRSEPHERNNPIMGICNSGGYPKSGMTYADIGRNITQGESSSPLNILHSEKGNHVEPSVNNYVLNNAVMDMDDNAQMFAEMASRCAPIEKGNRRLPFESLHHGEVPSFGSIAAEGGLHPKTNEHPDLFSGSHVKPSGRAFTLNHVEDDININMFRCPGGELSQEYPRGLCNYVQEGNWSDAPRDQSSVLRGVHFTGEVSSPSRMVEESLRDENRTHNEFLLATPHDVPKYKMLGINGANYQGRPEENSKYEGHYRHVNNDRTINRFNGTSHNKFFTSGKSPFVCTLGEAQGRATPDVYVIDEGISSCEPPSTHEQKVQHHHLGGYSQGMILKENAQHIGDMKGESVGSVKAEGTQMEEVQEGRAVISRGGDIHANGDVSDPSYGRGMDDNTTSAIDQCDEESANDEDLSVQQAIINSLIDL